ncbi:lytic polysaccharide monooxygenase [Xylariaceae sp. FL0594]|nr:lytic polysaccharide monooxygenase [Xylariaceae sp. FL0594]
MKSFAAPLLVASLLGCAQAHFLFGRLILNGHWTKTWEYIREVQPKPDADADLALIYPQTEPQSIDLRCGRNASDFTGTVKTATVLAGDTIGFAAGEPMLKGDVKPWIYHAGITSAWLSKAPSDDLDAYTGDGDWFKILSVTGRTAQSLDYSDPANAGYFDEFKSLWGTYRLDSYNFTIPKATPPGKYLLRFEHIFPQEVDTQFYVNCAQIEVLENPNGGVEAPAPVVRIPGVYTRGQPDVYFATYLYSLTHNNSIESYVAPAPAVWGA